MYILSIYGLPSYLGSVYGALACIGASITSTSLSPDFEAWAHIASTSVWGLEAPPCM